MQTISIPDLGPSPLCPIQALQGIFHAFPASKTSHLFCMWRDSELIPLTDSVARKHLKWVSSIVHINPSLTFHMFRKSATTLAFHKGVPVQEKMQHGAWSSDAVWIYI